MCTQSEVDKKWDFILYMENRFGAFQEVWWSYIRNGSELDMESRWRDQSESLDLCMDVI